MIFHKNRALLVENMKKRWSVQYLVPLARLVKQILYCRITKKRSPIHVSFHITNKCNLRCNYCYANYEKRFDKPVQDFTTRDIISIIDDIYALGTRWVVLLGGEPLLRKDIGYIVKYIKSKNILCEIVTNGILIKKKIEAIKDADLLCVSIDGTEEANDAIRGNNTYKRAVEGLSIATRYGMNTRIHATLTKLNNNEENLEHLNYLARKFHTSFGYSSPILHDYNKIDELCVSKEDVVEFWKIVEEFKKKGANNYYSNDALDYVIQWPFDHAKIITDKKEFEMFPRFKVKPCFVAQRSCYIDSEGVVYPCLMNGIKNGLNLHEVGFKKAWDYLKDYKCGACAYLQYVEFSNVMNLDWHSFGLGVKTFFRR